MNNLKNNVAIIQTASPDYRKRLYDSIYLEKTFNFKLYTGASYFESTVKTAKYEGYCIPIRNIFLFKRHILIQTGILKPIISAKTLVIEMNPRILTNWLALLVRKITFKKTIVWGHAWPRQGSQSKSDTIRNIMRLLADEIIVYTKRQQNELQQKMPYKKIKYAANALYFKKEMNVPNDLNCNKCNNIIYVGRLTKLKKVFLLLQAFNNVISEIPESSNLILIGDGEEKIKIKDYIESYNLQNRVTLFGHVSDYALLKKYYETSLISVSPGYVGLSITQSLGFGVPMIISKDENHSPEIEAVTPENALFFETDNIENLSLLIKQVYNNKDYWISKRQQISKECAQNYSIELMSQTFIDAFKI